MQENSSSQKPFLLGLSISVFFILAFFTGAIADRVFEIKPLDYLLARSGTEVTTESHIRFDSSSEENTSLLGQLLQGNANASVADVAEVASESVVTVSIRTQQRVIDPLDDFFGFGTGRLEEIERDIGTGFVVHQSGLIVTNRHVVSNPQAEYKVIDTKDNEYLVSQIYRDPVNDLAILQVEGASLPPLALGNSDTIRVGESVIAIGTALGQFRHTVTTGVISGLGRGIVAGDRFSTEMLDNVIQTDAAINPGNSGGPLLNARGEVIAVNVAVSQAGQNIGFALPINVIKASIDNFNETGRFDRPFLGVSYQMIEREAALFNNVPQGAYVMEIVSGSVAEEAGIQVGDIITEISGQDMSEVSLAEVINGKRIGEQVEIQYWREGVEQTVTVTLRAAQE
ncbi:MAG: trypsin-like peptidase domain-containing protein [Patescibacteria group bacterium]